MDSVVNPPVAWNVKAWDGVELQSDCSQRLAAPETVEPAAAESVASPWAFVSGPPFS
jgi:hypothetical protein